MEDTIKAMEERIKELEDELEERNALIKDFEQWLRNCPI